MSSLYERYLHHDKAVFVMSALKGKHRRFCLCYSCKRFITNMTLKAWVYCLRAKILYLVDVIFGLTTPVWECPKFDERPRENEDTGAIANE